MPTPPQRIHGGPDAFGAPRFDFSTNSNACGPCPVAMAAVKNADASRYPDASYSALRQQLAAFHGVSVQRVVLAASASEFIFRITAMVAGRRGANVSSVWLPRHSYGDYAHAAAAHGLTVVTDPRHASLYWACEPSSPLGAAHEDWQGSDDAVRVIDRAYEPLRLSGQLTLPESRLSAFWQLYSPNKALGLTGVRAAYAIAPLHAENHVLAMEQLCPSWPIGAHGVAMLQAWVQPDAQSWLAGSLDTLRDWKAQQLALCESFGWTVLSGDANYFVCRSGQGAEALNELRIHGIKLRDCASFGLPGHVRLSVQPPAAQEALATAWQDLIQKNYYGQ
ncbi:MAG: aminotransferase class I/II-fold pyridoxal phosphate-dependent enzyme [Polaromonas sp.]|nr:aminotransferase class I/II-fold pyridoxal phosphate-dependent enzyme [Polaromonas sp.]